MTAAPPTTAAAHPTTLPKPAVGAGATPLDEDEEEPVAVAAVPPELAVVLPLAPPELEAVVADPPKSR